MGRLGTILFITPNLRGVPDGLNRIQPGLGVMLLAAVLRRQGHQVHVYDAALDGWEHRTALNGNTVLIGAPDEQIAAHIRQVQPDVVAISVLFSNLSASALRIAAISRDAAPQARIVMGGNHISNSVSDYLYARQTPDSGLPAILPEAEAPGVDCLVWGEADEAVVELMSRMLSGEDHRGLPGVVYRDRDGIHVNPRARYSAALGHLPHPARDLVDMEGYFRIGAFHSPKSRSARVLSVMASRGCPEECTFCTTPMMWGSKVRWRDPADVAAEIDDAKEMFDIGEVQFEDDTLTANRGNLMRLCQHLERIGLPWCTPNGTKVNYHARHRDDMYRAMAGAGCYQITLACESGVQRVLDDLLNKNLDREHIVPAIESAKAAGMLVHTFWILGIPGESRDDIQATIDFALASGADSFSFSILNPLPGTPVYRQVARDRLWWPGRSLDDLLFRSSLVQVDGFDGPEEFETFVAQTNVNANKLLAQRAPDRFSRKYGTSVSERDLARQV